MKSVLCVAFLAFAILSCNDNATTTGSTTDSPGTMEGTSGMDSTSTYNQGIGTGTDTGRMGTDTSGYGTGTGTGSGTGSSSTGGTDTGRNR